MKIKEKALNKDTVCDGACVGSSCSSNLLDWHPTFSHMKMLDRQPVQLVHTLVQVVAELASMHQQ